ncbi:MAG: DUF6049 family protein [Acidimicrobiales bacterium]
MVRGRYGRGAEPPTQRGNAVLTTELGPPDSSTWLASRELTTDAAAKLWALGVRRLVLPAGSYDPGPDGAASTPTQPFEIRTPLVSPLQAVAIDAGLPGRFTLSDDPQLAAHHLLTELAVIHDEAPDQRRGVVLTPPPGWKASRALLLTLLQDLESSPLLEPATIDGLFSAVPPAEEESGGTTSPVVRALTPLPTVPLATHAATLAELRSRLTSYEGMVGRTPQVDAWMQRLLVSGSSALTSARRNRYLEVISSTIKARIASIEAPRRQTVTLTAREGRIPLTLRSGFNERVTVALELETSRRLEFPEGNRVNVTLDPGTEQVNIRVRTRSPGDSPRGPGGVTGRCPRHRLHSTHDPLHRRLGYRHRVVRRRRRLPRAVVGQALAALSPGAAPGSRRGGVISQAQRIGPPVSRESGAASLTNLRSALSGRLAVRLGASADPARGNAASAARV